MSILQPGYPPVDATDTQAGHHVERRTAIEDGPRGGTDPPPPPELPTRELSSGSVIRPFGDSSSSAAGLPRELSHGRDTRGGSLVSTAEMDKTRREREAAGESIHRRKWRHNRLGTPWMKIKKQTL